MKEKQQQICPITYESLRADDKKYSIKGLKLLSRSLKSLNDLPLSAEQQRIEAQMRASKMSVQGVQPKLSAVLKPKEQAFKICDRNGNYILKPPSALYPELPENEDLSMRLAAGMIEVPLHGLLYSVDGSFTYFIKRFDRPLWSQKLALEDFCQLSGLDRETKYEFTMEKMIPIIEKFCTFPVVDKEKLFTRTVFNFLIGNEDMHLKNFSLISREGKIELSPAYDYINTTIAMGNVKEEIALSLHEKKNNLRRRDIIEYYGMERLGLNEVVLIGILDSFRAEIPRWEKLIDISFLSEKFKEDYLRVLLERTHILGL